MPDLLVRLRPAPTRRPELDGLRGVAILLVFVAHLFAGTGPYNRPFLAGIPSWLPGGGLTGVQLFFVLSGYLITTILVRDFATLGAHTFGRFYLRRAKRLLPALIAICAAYGVWVATRYHGHARHLGYGSIRAALTYTSNLPLFANDGYLGHTWSLAVEEQFYLVWPLFLFGLLRLGGPRTAAVFAVIAVVATDVVRHTLDIAPNTSWTLFRWDALMVGAALALVPIRTGAWLGYVGIAVLAYYSLSNVTYQSEVYLVTALASGAVLVTAVRLPWLRATALQYFGLISYGLYLWHMLIMRLGLPGPLSLITSIAIATASYILLELPILRWRFPARPA